MNTKIDYPEKLLSIVKSINNTDYLWYEDGQYFITNEWFIGNFAGRAFCGDTEYDAAKKMHEYFIEHINHDGLVGNIVTNVNYPKCLDKDYPMCLYDMGIVYEY